MAYDFSKFDAAVAAVLDIVRGENARTQSAVDAAVALERGRTQAAIDSAIAAERASVAQAELADDSHLDDVTNELQSAAVVPAAPDPAPPASPAP